MSHALLTLALLLPAAPAPAPKDEMPKGPPPRIVRIAADADGRFHATEIRTVTVAQQQTEVRQVGQRKVQVTRTVLVPLHQEVRLSLEGAKYYGTDGKPIEAEEAKKRLRRPVPALVSSDGRPVDPFYLRLARDGTLVLVLPADRPPDGVPVPAEALPVEPRPPRP